MDDPEAEEQAYLRALLASPDARLFRGPAGDLVLELRAERESPPASPWEFRDMRRTRARLVHTSAEATKPYRLGENVISDASSVIACAAPTAGGVRPPQTEAQNMNQDHPPVLAPAQRSKQPPSVGRSVHYHPESADWTLWDIEPEDAKAPLAAIIASVHAGSQPGAAEDREDRVALSVLLPHGEWKSVRSAPYSETKAPGSWGWMPHVGPRQ